MTGNQVLESDYLEGGDTGVIAQEVEALKTTWNNNNKRMMEQLVFVMID